MLAQWVVAARWLCVGCLLLVFLVHLLSGRAFWLTSALCGLQERSAT